MRKEDKRQERVVRGESERDGDGVDKEEVCTRLAQLPCTGIRDTEELLIADRHVRC